MRCAECTYYDCCRRSPLGGCDMDKQTSFVHLLPSVNEILQIEVHKTQSEVKEILERERKLHEAAQKLVECVERYTYPKGQKLCRRSELLIACNQLKELL